MAPEPTIYIVDDDDAVRDSLSILLRIDGFTVQGYASAQAFLDDPPSGVFGCLVTDVHMAGMSGLQLLDQITAMQIALPVIVITGRTSMALGAQAMAAGATAILEKPFSPDEFVAAVRAALAGGRSRET